MGTGRSHSYTGRPIGPSSMGRILGLALGVLPGASAWAGDDLDGIWQSRGYAMLVEIRGPSLDLFQATDTTLLPLTTFPLEEDRLVVDSRTTLVLTRDADVLRMSDLDQTLTIEFEALPRLPAVSEFTSDPVVSFELLAELFEENYALFDLNDIDWPQVTAEARRQVSPAMTDNALFDLFSEMLAPLNDRHTRVSNGQRLFISGPATNPFWQARRGDILEILSSVYLDQGELHDAFSDDRVRFGTIDDDVLYLLIDTFAAARPTQSLLPDTLDAILVDFQSVEGVIIDLRFNGGGRESNGIALLDRLTDRDRVVFTRETRSPLDAGFTPLETILTRPQGINLGGRPVVILTSGETASTGDTVMLGAAYLPWVTQVGTTTKGIFSGNLGLVLANGWELSLSHQRTFSPRMEFLEQQGVAPDIPARLTAIDLAQGRDPMIETALDHLASVPVPLGSTSRVSPATTGIWFDPGHSGEGWIIEVLPDSRAFLTWFSYGSGASPAQAWMTGVGVVEGAAILVEDLQITSGARFGDGFDPDDVQRTSWGRIEFHFETCDSGYVIYEGPAGFRSGVQRLTRLAGIEGLNCGAAQATDATSAVRHSGSWYDPERSGEGWMLVVSSNADAFLAWFTYDGLGGQTWLVGNGEVTPGGVRFPELLRPIGGRFGPSFDPGSVNREPWGALQMQFDGCDAARIEYQTDDPDFEDGFRDTVRLTRPAGLSCDDAL